MTEHNHEPGDRVTVMNTTLGGRVIEEGKATIVRRLPTCDHYEVRFDSEPEQTYERFVE